MPREKRSISIDGRVGRGPEVLARSAYARIRNLELASHRSTLLFRTENKTDFKPGEELAPGARRQGPERSRRPMPGGGGGRPWQAAAAAAHGMRRRRPPAAGGNSGGGRPRRPDFFLITCDSLDLDLDLGYLICDVFVIVIVM
uniref:Uncharacterized protein n=1 Tax=Oryza sativa subsp. japonica TaxID=39947 RepID=Q8H394_ORYSJ|nr:hypothetical protein [Oryza sativa Japonica Group]